MLEMLQEVFGPSFADHVSFICPAQSFGPAYLPIMSILFALWWVVVPGNWLAKYVQ